MRNPANGLVMVMTLLAASSAAQAQHHLMRFADVHGDRIVFTYENDLWIVSTEGGDARRLTSDPGAETWAKFSPDGQLLAFSAQYDGGTDIYVMDANGGVPKRLTYHPAPDRMLEWFPDGKHILFRSRRTYPSRAHCVYKVSVDGGMPVKLPVDRAGLTTISEDGTKIAYNRISRELRGWKRHRGGTAQDIWVGDLSQGDYARITDYPGTDNFPMWRGRSIYFVSDRAHDTLNLHRYDLDTRKVETITHYKDYDLRCPSLGVDKMVFQYAQTLHLMDLATNTVREVPIDIPSDRVRVRPELVEVAPTTGSFGLSPAGKRVVLTARGEVLNYPADEGIAVNVTRTTDTREKNAVWSPDGKHIALISDRTGEEEVYLVDPKGQKPWRQLTSDGNGYRMHLAWSPDSKWIVFADKYMKLNLVSAETGEAIVIDQGEYDDGWERWGIQDYVWSPDSRWVAYTKMEQSLNESIFLYSMAGKSVHRVTDYVHTDFSPSFDPQGQYLYFLSNRTFAPIMGFQDQNYVFLDMCTPHMVVLQEDAPSPFAPEDAQVTVAEDDDTDSEAADEGEETAENDDRIQIDLSGIENRILAVSGVPAGNYFRLSAIDGGFLYLAKSENEFTKYQNVNDQSGGALDLYNYDLEEEQTSKVLGGIANYHLSADASKLIYRAGSSYGVVDTGSDASVGDGLVELDALRIKVDRLAEYHQIFDEAYRVQRDWFYDPGMHGVDWDAMAAKYRKFIPHCGNRSDLNYLITEMIGELNIGHTYVWGGDVEFGAKPASTGLLGADFEAEPGAAFFKIKHIIPGTRWDNAERSPMARVGLNISDGDYLISIDGEEVTTGDNIYRLLQHKAGQCVRIVTSPTPTPGDREPVIVRTLYSEQAIRYREWVDRNRAYVDRASHGRVGYVHIPDMGRSGLIEFARYYHPNYFKKGFVIDERYNGGGFTSGMIIDRLERRVLSMTKPREGNIQPNPERVFNGHLIVLVNEDTGSAGEWFAQGIKDRGLAQVLGKRTWGGAVGIEPHQTLMDGGVTTPPQFAPYGMDRKWLIEGHGVDPDIDVQNMPGDVIRGIDAQLDAALEYLLGRLEGDPKQPPAPPAFPDKSKKQ